MYSRSASNIRKIFKAILVIISALAMVFVLWLWQVSRQWTVPILMYHYINDEEPQRSRLGVSPKTFEKQMRFLRRHNYNVIGLSDLADLLIEKKKIPPKTVVITFDDGYYDNYSQAFPILKKYSIPATIFIVIDRIGRRVGNDQYMDWSQIKELSDSGLVTIGSHSLSHPNLTEVDSDDNLKTEIFESKRIIEQVLEGKAELFSYPFGGVNLKARAFVIKAGYKAAVGTNFPNGYPNDDVYALKRLRISENAKSMFIFAVEISGHYTYIKEHRDTYY